MEWNVDALSDIIQCCCGRNVNLAKTNRRKKNCLLQKTSRRRRRRLQTAVRETRTGRQ